MLPGDGGPVGTQLPRNPDPAVQVDPTAGGVPTVGYRLPNEGGVPTPAAPSQDLTNLPGNIVAVQRNGYTAYVNTSTGLEVRYGGSS